MTEPTTNENERHPDLEDTNQVTPSVVLSNTPAEKPTNGHPAPDINQAATELAVKVINAARGGAPDPVTGIPKGSLAIALQVSANATDEVLSAAIVQVAAPEWRLSQQWIGQLSREGKVLALAWLAHVYHQGYVHGRLSK